MYHKVRNTLVGLAVALAVTATSYSIGQPPMQATAGTQLSPASELEASADVLRGSLGRQSRGMRSQLSMPFFSFAPLLPKQGT